MKAIYALVGMKYRDAEAFVRSLPHGEPLTLRRDRANEHDANAVEVWARDRHVAFIPRNQNATLAKIMDLAGMDAHGTLVHGSSGPLVQLEE